MLYLISLGIWDEKDLSIRGLEAAKSCSKVYAEFYTTQMNTSPEKLEALIGKSVQILERSGMEENASKLVQEAQEKNIAVLVGGDALSATTHLSLIQDCKKARVPFKIIHSSSILTAVGEAGLSLYKFGETVTIPRWTQSYKPSSFYETVVKNNQAGLHTLILLEIDMPVEEAMKILKELDKENIFKKLISISKLGSDSLKISFDSVGEAPAVLLLPGRLNEFEKEFLELL